MADILGNELGKLWGFKIVDRCISWVGKRLDWRGVVGSWIFAIHSALDVRCFNARGKGRFWGVNPSSDGVLGVAGVVKWEGRIRGSGEAAESAEEFGEEEPGAEMGVGWRIIVSNADC
jgi:hypothetical protein